MSLNFCVFEGRLGRDPEIKTTPSGTTVVDLSVAVDRPYRSGEERATDWIDCVAWRKTAEFIAKFFKKGDPIVVQGSLQIRKYIDRDGNNRRKAEIVVDKADFVVPSKKEPGAVGSPDSAFTMLPDLGDENPF